jgi:hypothetical protein
MFARKMMATGTVEASSADGGIHAIGDHNDARSIL